MVFEDLARALGIATCHVIDPTLDPARLSSACCADCLAAGELAVIIARRDCLLATGKIKTYEQAIQEEPATHDRHRAQPAVTEASVTNIVIAGLGGQGVLKASDILADAAFRAGFDVKKSEIHGMSQRGGSVTSDVRFGGEVLQPDGAAGRSRLPGRAGADQVENNRWQLRPAAS